jgi:purine-binding chemotaxis protein CheW
LPDDAVTPAPAETPTRPSSEAAVLEATPPALHRHRACVVTLGGRPFAVDVRDAREVVTLEALTTVPGAPAPLVGVANLRGSVLGVAEARPLLGVPSQPVTPGSPALVIAAGDLQAAMPIDRVVGLDWFDAPLPLDPDDPRPGAALATGLVPHAGDHATLLDAGRLLEALRAPWAPPAPEAS